MDVKDWLSIGAIILGPILAVQAQKAVEGVRDRKMRKLWVFGQLMATRAARVSPDHVRALNMIDLTFFGRRIGWVLRRSKQEQAVLDAWKEYLDHLNTRPEDAGLALWGAQGNELFANLLLTMALDTGFTFDRVELKKGVYSPIAHNDLETEQVRLRQAAIRVLSGEAPLQMNVVGFPFDVEAAEAHKESVQRLGAALESGALKVVMVDGAPSQLVGEDN
ncbi:MAG: hypothetical protein B7X46_06535 [Thiomonas sp. 15-66-11]|jgi:hypothetical protein|nr:MAG: hypothetical protein B7X46_06535 [Thiomonas sp. 15-66-11]